MLILCRVYLGPCQTSIIDVKIHIRLTGFQIHLWNCLLNHWIISLKWHFLGELQCFSLSQQLPPETCSIKTVFFKISQNAQKNKRFPVNFLRTNKKEERGTKRKFLRTAIPYKTSVFLPSKKCTNYLFFSQVTKFPRLGYVLYFKNFLFLPKQISA